MQATTCRAVQSKAINSPAVVFLFFFFVVVFVVVILESLLSL